MFAQHESVERRPRVPGQVVNWAHLRAPSAQLDLTTARGSVFKALEWVHPRRNGRENGTTCGVLSAADPGSRNPKGRL